MRLSQADQEAVLRESRYFGLTGHGTYDYEAQVLILSPQAVLAVQRGVPQSDIQHYVIDMMEQGRVNIWNVRTQYFLDACLTGIISWLGYKSIFDYQVALDKLGPAILQRPKAY